LLLSLLDKCSHFEGQPAWIFNVEIVVALGVHFFAEILDLNGVYGFLEFGKNGV
jgi:hypothetical protein